VRVWPPLREIDTVDQEHRRAVRVLPHPMLLGAFPEKAPERDAVLFMDADRARLATKGKETAAAYLMGGPAHDEQRCTG
jgi:hypothetical protein